MSAAALQPLIAASTLTRFIVLGRDDEEFPPRNQRRRVRGNHRGSHTHTFIHSSHSFILSFTNTMFNSCETKLFPVSGNCECEGGARYIFYLKPIWSLKCSEAVSHRLNQARQKYCQDLVLLDLPRSVTYFLNERIQCLVYKMSQKQWETGSQRPRWSPWITHFKEYKSYNFQ